MKRTTLHATIIGALALSATAFGISAAVGSPRTLMSPGDYSATRNTIEAGLRGALAKCRDLEGQAEDICKAEARADRRIRLADLEADYRGTVAAAADARLSRAKARYDVAKVKCVAEHGDGKFACLRSARAGKEKALSEGTLASAT
jgi:hypothetical protein